MPMKKTLLILPGWGGTKATWQDFATIAQAHFDVQVLELPCFGNEPCPTTVWGVEEYAEFVKNKIKTLGISRENLIILGHSFGGQVATYVVSHDPHICDTLILSGAAVIRETEPLKKQFFGIIAKAGNFIFSLPLLSKLRPFAQKVLYRLADSPDYLNTSGIKRDIFKKITQQDMQHELANVKTKTLVVWGTEDRMTPLGYGKRIAAMLPHAKFSIIEKGTHGLHHETREKLLAIIINFVQA